ncbi:hypothetical protein COB21_00140 [Candidatus Aerophobetes bacterium]|uniref:LptD C-terminal domain-containing protein n=1 Tax=Aerophobetes bacterium TaxID=2030807 RepID=A0A2A4X7U9_UNCAE|nr:MAG: hypothetical protein COB21_00140 [Candidatus Aerophobetes bacterium]
MHFSKLSFILLIFLLCAPLIAFSTAFDIDLNAPEYKQGTLSTTKGGILTMPDLKVQAKNIIYHTVSSTSRSHSIIAWGDLMVRHQGKWFIGEKFQYDFIQRTGVIKNGITRINLWHVGAKTIFLEPNKTLGIENGYITTSDDRNISWKIDVGNINIDSQEEIIAKNITFRVKETPLFYLPYFKSNLHSFKKSPVNYALDWETGLFPKFSMRYRVYSYKDLNVFFRFLLRPTKGLGGAIETHHKNSKGNREFLTRSYLDHDAFFRDNNPNKARTHYRFQGKFKADTSNIKFNLNYDYLSDRNLQTDFKSPDFVLNTAKKTYSSVIYYGSQGISGIDTALRVNSFQALKQKLPEAFFLSKTFLLGSSGITNQNTLKCSYLDYVFAKDVQSALHDFKSLRVSTLNTISRPFNIHILKIAPSLSFEGIFYTRTRKDRPNIQALLRYQCLASIHSTSHFKNLFLSHKPYVNLYGITSPTLKPDTPYIFGLNDGLAKILYLKSGWQESIFLSRYPLFAPNITLNCYAYSFFLTDIFDMTTPKLRFDMTYQFPRLKITNRNGWNFQTKSFDFNNLELAWTFNENFAIKTELRHRSPFYWRRADHNNFVFEVVRPLSKLSNSPLSDGRNSLITKFQAKVAPLWTAKIESHIGWGRGNEANYNEVRVNIDTIISTCWKLKMTFTHSPAPEKKNNSFMIGLSLIDPQP